MIDTHVHSNNSCDSNASIDTICNEAIKRNFKHLCFTEHFDMNPNDNGTGFFDFKRYSEEINRAREKYADQLTILKGIEFSEPHRYPAEFDKLQKLNFDFVIGSIHWFHESWIADRTFQSANTTEHIFEMYYDEVLKAVSFGGFDSLAHIDFPKRYLEHTCEPMDMIDQVLKAIIKKGIALELNSSPIRKGKSQIYPSDTICRLFSERGGRNVTIGSDAHSENEIGQDMEICYEIVKNYAFTILIYKNRKAEKIENRIPLIYERDA